MSPGLKELIGPSFGKEVAAAGLETASNDCSASEGSDRTKRHGCDGGAIIVSLSGESRNQRYETGNRGVALIETSSTYTSTISHRLSRLS